MQHICRRLAHSDAFTIHGQGSSASLLLAYLVHSIEPAAACPHCTWDAALALLAASRSAILLRSASIYSHMETVTSDFIQSSWLTCHYCYVSLCTGSSTA